MRHNTRTEFTARREKAGMTVAQAAELMDVSPRTARRYEDGESKPRRLEIKALERIAQQGAKEPPTRFRFIDLCAGIGGLRRGFESIGGHCAFTSEWDPH